jgi:L-fuculose-phosphate aldolase
MSAAGFVVGTAGNVSARDPDSGLIAVTPSGIPYEAVEAADVVLLDPQGNVANGTRRPSTESPMHLAIYTALAGVGGIVHTHSPYATAFALVGKPIRVAMAEGAAVLGPVVSVAAYATTGTRELGEIVARELQASRVVLLANHGVVAVAETVEDALVRARVAEEVARIQLYAEALGGAVPLPPDDIEKIREAYERGYGQR